MIDSCDQANGHKPKCTPRYLNFCPRKLAVKRFANHCRIKVVGNMSGTITWYQCYLPASRFHALAITPEKTIGW